MASPFVRHLLLFVGGALAAYALASFGAERADGTGWLLAGLVLGVLAALVARGWLGLPIVIVGAGAGLLVEVHLRLGESARAAEELFGGTALAQAALGLVAGYIVTLLVLLLLRRSRRG